jgi:hypothetical protein
MNFEPTVARVDLPSPPATTVERQIVVPSAEVDEESQTPDGNSQDRLDTLTPTDPLEVVSPTIYNDPIIIDTTNHEEVRKWAERVKNYEPGVTQDTSIQQLVDMLPKNNSLTGKALTQGRILKAILKVVPAVIAPDSDLVSKTVGSFKKENWVNYWMAVEDMLWLASHLTILKAAILFGFSKIIEEANNQPIADNCKLNKVALLAHLVVHPDAVETMERLYNKVDVDDRPAFLDQTGGAKAWRLSQYEILRKISENIKNGLDNRTNYSEAWCGEDAFLALRAIDPGEASFKSALELKELHTYYMNANDTLTTRLDHSGSNLDGVARRVKCFDSFVGGHGRAKDMCLYYCFLTWENVNTRFTSRSLPPGKGKGSHDPPPVVDPTRISGTKRARQDAVESLAATTIAVREIISAGKTVVPPNETAVKSAAALTDQQTALLLEKTNTEKTTRLQVGMQCAPFHDLSDEMKNQVQAAWVASLLG